MTLGHAVAPGGPETAELAAHRAGGARALAGIAPAGLGLDRRDRLVAPEWQERAKASAAALAIGDCRAVLLAIDIQHLGDGHFMGMTRPARPPFASEDELREPLLSLSAVASSRRTLALGAALVPADVPDGPPHAAAADRDEARASVGAGHWAASTKAARSSSRTSTLRPIRRPRSRPLAISALSVLALTA
jgi:hypothetical protein